MPIGVYVRVSTPNQVQNQTIEQQLDRIRQHLAEQGDELAAEHIFRDDGYSGARLSRPGLDRLRDAVREGEFDRLLITAPDRLARNYVHQMLLIEEFERCGCQVEFLERPMSQDPHDQLVLQIRGAVAEYERTLITERMRRGRQAKLRAGILLPWTRPPYGYQVPPERPRDPASVTRDPVAAAVVQEIFVCYGEPGATLQQVARALHARGICSPTGRAWWGLSTLRGMLTNPVYLGHVYAGRLQYRPPQVRRSATHPLGRPHASGVSVPPEAWLLVATVPALVSQEQFDRVQAKLTHNRACARRHNTTHTYLLRALVSCGVCRLACTARTVNHQHAYYLCSGKTTPTNSHRAHRCPARFIPAHQLDALVWQDLCAVLTHPESLAQALERAQAGRWLPQELQARQRTLRHARASLAQQRERLTDAYLHGIIALPEFEQRRRDLEQKDHAMALQEEQLSAQAHRHKERTALATGMQAFCQRVSAGLTAASVEQQRQLVELLIDRVVVTDDDVEIRYCIPTTPASEHVRFCHLRTDYFGGPPLDLGMGERRGDRLQQRSEVCLKVSCCAGSASAWRGRGTCGLCLRRCR
jgi:site-specific DNA recombinase